MDSTQQNLDAVSEDGVTDSPKRGPTLSTSTSSFEPLDPHDPNLSKLATTMFQKTSDYLLGELTLTQADYKLLEAMNIATVGKCNDMTQMTQQIKKNMVDLQEKYESLRPVLEQINEIEASVMKLEKAAYKLDAYSKRLENKVKTLERK
ncbi:biogenesis of lysosome-related organelles complex 1 subunit 2 [Halyomorpha halys]|uniref:biogenesis of lysosome-related organelles complex 1 subunit 2 n=1 Tax=Halyomorpha halys TaxID=286706 RepID=UPI0006D504CF|nr:biogenesis of lysosome-related organelles complex 1 subunit 2 [Halyomorpha halys]